MGSARHRQVVARARVGERGLSLIEVLVVLAITSVIAAIMFSTTSTGVRENFETANMGLEYAERATAEATFRRVLRGVVQPDAAPGSPLPVTTAAGTPTALVVATELDEAAACAPKGHYSVLMLRIVSSGQGGRLLCEGGEQTTEMLAWQSGRATFAYSHDASTWSDRWPTQRLTLGRARNSAESGVDARVVEAPLVRLLIEDRGHNTTLWIERAGHTAPAAIDRLASPGVARSFASRS
jgi:prepilin-type N-terminal cleavage/methylation domain-containing protein